MNDRPLLELPQPPRAIGFGDPGFPRELGDLSDPPLVLHLAGRSPPWPGPVAVVGTRRADECALDFAYDLGATLGSAGCTVVSGGALGIDAAAHEGALDAGGITVAVLATGLQRAYPARNAPLLQRIAERGALVSEDADCHPQPGRFLARNRLIAALARRVVVVQAPARSGALSTAAHARGLRRPVLAVPSAPWDPRGRGCLALLAEGAGICTHPRDALSVPTLGVGEGARPSGTEDENAISDPGMSPENQAVLAELGRRPRHVDQVIRATSLPAARVQQALMELVLLGLAEESAPGQFRRPPSRSDPPGPH